MQIRQLSFCYVSGAEWGSIPTHITKAFYIFVRQLQFPPFLLPKPLVFLRFSSYLLNSSRSTVANVGSAVRPLHVIKILRQHSIHTHAHTRTHIHAHVTRTRHTHIHAYHTHITRSYARSIALRCRRAAGAVQQADGSKHRQAARKMTPGGQERSAK
jgi:hypothetical protein